MKNLFLVSVLVSFALASGSAMAEWVRVSSNDKVTTYADPGAARKRLNIVKIWTLFDFKAENTLSDGSQYYSIMRETEFNCRENLQRMLSYSIYSGRMGKGKILESGAEPQELKPVSKANIAQEMKNFACSKD
jgi:hypothetical protein